MNETASIKKVKGHYCGKCGSENPLDARFCKSCGFFTGEVGTETETKISQPDVLEPPKPVSTPEEPRKKRLSSRCPRCGQDIEGLERCALCGLLAPMGDDEPEDFPGDFMVGVPLMLSNPERFAEILPYRRGLHTMLQPILWTTLFFIIFWVVIYLAGARGFFDLAGARLPMALFLLISTTILVVLMPWLIALYIIVIHGTSLLLGGRGLIERMGKMICIVLSSGFLFTATLMLLYFVAERLLKKHEFFLSSSPWHDQYQAIPLVLKILMFLGQFFLLTAQIRLVARAEYIEPWRSVAAHIIAAVPFIVLFFLNSYGYI